MWGNIVKEIHVNLDLPNNCNGFPPSQNGDQLGNLVHNIFLERIRSALPKYVFWKVWKTRNYEIFENKMMSQVYSTISTRSLLGEAIQSHIKNNNMQDTWNLKEDMWVKYFLNKKFPQNNQHGSTAQIPQ